MQERRAQCLLLSLCLVAMAATAWLVCLPQPPRLGKATTGDPALAARVRAAVSDADGFRGLSVAVVDRGRTAFAGLGDSGNREHPAVGESTVFEVGSIGKPMTGMLLSSLADKRRLDIGKPLGDLLPRTYFSDPALASVTLTDLLTHRSGLGPMPAGLDTTRRDLELRLLGRDPYHGLTEQDVFSAAANAPLGAPGNYVYSNLGVALAGQTAARVVGAPYEELLQEEVIGPLGMKNTGVVQRAEDIPRRSASGMKGSGPAMDHWTASGFTPAGDVWSTSSDLALLLRAISTGAAPGAVNSTRPLHALGPTDHVGLGWNISRAEGRDVLWHNGETGGFTSFVALDRTTDRGVVVLSNTDKPVDSIGRRLLGIDEGAGDRSYETSWGGPLTVLFSLGAGLPALWTAARRRQPERHCRTRMAVDVLCGICMLAVTWRLGAWLAVPPGTWGVGLVLLTAGTWLFLLRLRDTEDAAGVTEGPQRPARPVPFVAGRAAVLAAAVVTLI